MGKKTGRLKKYFVVYIMALGAVVLTVCMVKYPDISFEAAAQGLQVWFEIVFPALLPFFIAGQVLMGLGVVHFLGVLLEPFMRPVFNIPGAGAFVMAMGLASGYPIGAVLTAELRRKEMITRVEAERLMSFTNTADPLFMFGAVAVGMFGIVQVGITISLAHYISTIMVGLVLRFYGLREDSPLANTTGSKKKGNILSRALKALYEARQNDGRAFGRLMGDAIRESVNTLLLVGGFIILFSVVIKVATLIGLTTALGLFFAKLLHPFGFHPSLADACISGLFEITIGSHLAGSAVSITGQGLAPLIQRVAIASGIIAWSGFSVHCQVAAIIVDTDIRMGAFIAARILHAVLATAVALVLFQYGAPVLSKIAIPVFLQTTPQSPWPHCLSRFRYFGIRMGVCLLVPSLVAIIHSHWARVRIIWLNRVKR